MMVFLFWGISFCLLLLAVGLIIPWLSGFRLKAVIFVGLGIFTYVVYGKLGYSQQLQAYYSVDRSDEQAQRHKMQPLMMALKKQEYRLRLYLEDYSDDRLAQSQLLEILGIQAMQAGDQVLARRCLEQALSVMGEGGSIIRKQHLQGLLADLYSEAS